MFLFTTTTVINSLQDYTTGKDLIVSKDGVLRIKRLNPFTISDICKIWKSEAEAPQNEVLKISKVILQSKDKRIGLYIRSIGNADPMYANDLVFKGKPLYIEIPANTTADNLLAIVNKYMNLVFGGEAQLIATVADSKLVLTCVNPYQKFTKVTTAERNEQTGEFGDGTPVALTADNYTPGKEGFGDYDHILKDLRLPTAANLRWKRTMEDEMPVPGAKYNEYVIEYAVDRGVMGISAVGQKVTSVTTHVLWVNQAIAQAFEGKLGDASTKLEVAPKYPKSTTSNESDNTESNTTEDNTTESNTTEPNENQTQEPGL